MYQLIHTLKCVIFSVYPLFSGAQSVCKVWICQLFAVKLARGAGGRMFGFCNDQNSMFFFQIYVKEVACMTCDQFFCELMLMLLAKNYIHFQNSAKRVKECREEWLKYFAYYWHHIFCIFCQHRHCTLHQHNSSLTQILRIGHHMITSKINLWTFR